MSDTQSRKITIYLTKELYPVWLDKLKKLKCGESYLGNAIMKRQLVNEIDVELAKLALEEKGYIVTKDSAT